LAASLTVVLAGGTVPLGRGAPAQLPLPPAQAGRNVEYSLAKLKEWRTAVAQHNAGELDEAVTTIASWRMTDLQAVVEHVREIARWVVDSRSHAPGSLEQEWLGLTDDEVRHGDANRILKRGALLHTDIALLAPDMGVSLPIYGPMQVKVIDGRAVGQTGGAHWQLARLLLDSVSPHPSSDEMVRQWYVATTAYMERLHQWGQAQTNLRRAMAVFPSDAGILFLNGVVHEVFASPASQNAVPPPGSRFDIESERQELGQAQLLLQQALQADPSLSEALLRLGRVTGLLGNHDEAIAELKKAAAALTDPQLQYYDALFLGHEQEALGHADAAREQFERAAMLYPTAQSPLLALSHLASRDGDPASLPPAMKQVLSMPITDPQREDPWWDYDVAHVRSANDVMAEMRKAFGELPR
jgi:tetratricopeptide (TPR) repeat protein